MEHDASSKTDCQCIGAFVGGDTVKDCLSSRASLPREPRSGCLAEECWGGLEPLNALSIDRPLQQGEQVRPVNAETHMPVQEDRPDRFSVKESARRRWKAVYRDHLQEIFGHPAMPGDTRINRTGLKQELDDLPAIKRKQPTPGQTHQDIITQFSLFQT